MRKLVNYINDKYNPGEIFITENGWVDDTGTLDDQDRIRYHKVNLKMHIVTVKTQRNIFRVI